VENSLVIRPNYYPCDEILTGEDKINFYIIDVAINIAKKLIKQSGDLRFYLYISPGQELDLLNENDKHLRIYNPLGIYPYGYDRTKEQRCIGSYRNAQVITQNSNKHIYGVNSQTKQPIKSVHYATLINQDNDLRIYIATAV